MGTVTEVSRNRNWHLHTSIISWDAL